MISELSAQRNGALDRCAVLAADNAELRAEIDALKKKLADQESKLVP